MNVYSGTEMLRTSCLELDNLILKLKRIGLAKSGVILNDCLNISISEEEEEKRNINPIKAGGRILSNSIL